MTEARELSLVTRDELYGLAQKHKIAGRSRMTKAELLLAVREATRQATPPVVARQPAADLLGTVQGTEAVVEAGPVGEPVETGEPSDVASADQPSGTAKPGTGEDEHPESTKGEHKSQKAGDKKDIGTKPGQRKKSKKDGSKSKKSRKSKKDGSKSKKSKKGKKNSSKSSRKERSESESG